MGQILRLEEAAAALVRCAPATHVAAILIPSDAAELVEHVCPGPAHADPLFVIAIRDVILALEQAIPEHADDETPAASMQREIDRARQLLIGRLRR